MVVVTITESMRYIIETKHVHNFIVCIIYHYIEGSEMT